MARGWKGDSAGHAAAARKGWRGRRISSFGGSAMHTRKQELLTVDEAAWLRNRRSGQPVTPPRVTAVPRPTTAAKATPQKARANKRTAGYTQWLDEMAKIKQTDYDKRFGYPANQGMLNAVAQHWQSHPQFARRYERETGYPGPWGEITRAQKAKGAPARKQAPAARASRRTS